MSEQSGSMKTDGSCQCGRPDPHRQALVMADVDGLQQLGALVRRRFPAGDGIVYGWDGEYVTFWQVLAGHEVVWDAGPAMTEQIPQWHGLQEAVPLLQVVVEAARPQAGDWLVLRLP